VQVPCDEKGVAIRIGPDHATVAREGIRESVDRGAIGTAIASAKASILGCDTVQIVEGNSPLGATTAASRSERHGGSETLGIADCSLRAETGRSRGSTVRKKQPPVRLGKGEGRRSR